mmetsp:Transcript_117336/g.336611  ORF Transcript_117336/g.336611 Transcript_117336/m.336611 type:complete len:341 (-) Transcript_117336:83-1105(-)
MEHRVLQPAAPAQVSRRGVVIQAGDIPVKEAAHDEASLLTYKEQRNRPPPLAQGPLRRLGVAETGVGQPPQQQVDDNGQVASEAEDHVPRVQRHGALEAHRSLVGLRRPRQPKQSELVLPHLHRCEEPSQERADRHGDAEERDVGELRRQVRIKLECLESLFDREELEDLLPISRREFLVPPEPGEGTVRPSVGFLVSGSGGDLFGGRGVRSSVDPSESDGDGDLAEGLSVRGPVHEAGGVANAHGPQGRLAPVGRAAQAERHVQRRLEAIAGAVAGAGGPQELGAQPQSDEGEASEILQQLVRDVGAPTPADVGFRRVAAAKPGRLHAAAGDFLVAASG